MQILFGDADIFTTPCLTKFGKRTTVIFESRSTKARDKEIKMFIGVAREEKTKEREIWNLGGVPVHPHNQVILATHRTLITTINDSPVPFLRDSLSILLLPFGWRTARSGHVLRSANPPSSELMILREKSRCCLRPADEQKVRFARRDFRT